VLLNKIFVLGRICWATLPFARKKEEQEPTGNLSPYIEKDPVPSPLRKSPPNEIKM
jgi:hypothetical protein